MIYKLKILPKATLDLREISSWYENVQNDNSYLKKP